MEGRRDLMDSAVVTFFSRRSKLFVIAFCFLMVALLGIADYASGTRVRFFIFYWPPIAIVTWFVNRRWGYGLAAFAGLTWLGANWVDELQLENLTITFWNLAVNWTSFTFLSFVVAVLRRHVNVERDVARTDFLTGLANGRAFREALAAQVARSHRTGEHFSVAYLDVDGFKAVNDRFSHEVGDDLLVLIAKSLHRSLRGSDMAARLGGDEFSLLLPGTGPDAIRAVMGRVVADLKAAIAEGRWPISFSVGVVSCAEGPGPSGDLIHLADELMYQVKRRGKDGIEYLNCGVPAMSPAPAEPHASP